MLPQHGGHGHHPYPASAQFGRESTAYYGSPPTTGGMWPKKEWAGPSPDRQTGSSFNWESPYSSSIGGGGGGVPLASSPPPVPIQELDGVQRFPTGSTAAPAEMGVATPVAASAVPVPGVPAAAVAPAPVPATGQPQYQPYSPGQVQQVQPSQQQQYLGQPQQQYPGHQPYAGGPGWNSQPPQS